MLVTRSLWQAVSFNSLIVASAVFRGDIGYGYIQWNTCETDGNRVFSEV